MIECYICKKDKERHDIRPYGVDGQSLCLGCMKSSEELQTIAFNGYMRQFAIAKEQSDCDVVVVTNDGPTPAMRGRVYALPNYKHTLHH